MGMPSIPSGARLPIPGNAEFAFFVAIEIFLAILLFDDAWNVNDWAQWSAILGVRLSDQPRHRQGEPRPRAVTSARTAGSNLSFALSRGTAVG